MAKTRPPYSPEFRRQMVELVHAGRSPEELAQEFEPTAQSIRHWVGQAECEAGCRGDGLTTAQREEGFFSKLARSVLRHIRVTTKQELKDRILAAMDEFNRHPVVHTWSYKLGDVA